MKVYHNALLLPQMMRVTSKKIRKLLENTYRKRLCGRFLFLSIPSLILNNARYKPKTPELCSEPKREMGYEVVLHVYHTNQTLGKKGLRKITKTPPSTSNNASYKPKKTQNYSEPLSERGYEVVPIKNTKKFYV